MILCRAEYKLYTVLYYSLERYSNYVVSNSCTVLKTHFVINFIYYTYSKNVELWPMSVPFSGPAGDYKGAPHRPQYILAQESVYTGYKKMHGHKMDTVFFPNKISTCLVRFLPEKMIEER